MSDRNSDTDFKCCDLSINTFLIYVASKLMSLSSEMPSPLRSNTPLPPHPNPCSVFPITPAFDRSLLSHAASPSNLKPLNNLESPSKFDSTDPVSPNNTPTALFCSLDSSTADKRRGIQRHKFVDAAREGYNFGRS